MVENTLEISFEGTLASEASMLAADLEHDLRYAAPEAEITLQKSNPNAQDFGSTLVLVFGTPVAILLAKAVAAFLARNSGATIVITKDGDVVAKNLNSQDAARIAEAFAKSK